MALSIFLIMFKLRNTQYMLQGISYNLKCVILWHEKAENMFSRTSLGPDGIRVLSGGAGYMNTFLLLVMLRLVYHCLTLIGSC